MHGQPSHSIFSRRVTYVGTLAFLFATAFLFAGCGGGGGGDDPADPPKAWGKAALLEKDRGTIDEAKVVFDPAGNAIAVWRQEGDPLEYVYTKRYTPENGWGPVEQLSDPTVGGSGAYPAGIAMDPDVAVDAHGNAMAVWVQIDDTFDTNAQFSRYSAASGKWSKPAVFAGSASAPQVAFDGSGAAVAVWKQYDDPDYRLYASRNVSGTSWSTPALVGSSVGVGGYLTNITLAVSTTGKAMVVWESHDVEGGEVSVMANHFDGSDWETAVNIDNGALAAANPHAAFDATGHVLAVWEQAASAGGSVNIYARRYTEGSGWGGATAIDQDADSVTGAKVGFDQDGNAFAVWQRGRFGTGVAFNHYTRGQGWGDAAVIGEGTNMQDLSLAVGGQGTAMAVWREALDGGHYDIRASRYSAASGWGESKVISTNGNYAERPQVACDATGHAVAVWLQYDDPAGDTFANLWYNVFK